jgi:c(7)-type cytochrome triheme protein
VRYALVVFLILTFAGGVESAAQKKRSPAMLYFKSKAGEVHFNHAAHVKREKAVCSTCHDGLWPQSAKVEIKSSSGCATCHAAGAKAFEMKGHCAKCHAGGRGAGPAD